MKNNRPQFGEALIMLAKSYDIELVFALTVNAAGQYAMLTQILDVDVLRALLQTTMEGMETVTIPEEKFVNPNMPSIN
jgi:hypothetical protein